jgi:hypothetical protein
VRCILVLCIVSCFLKGSGQPPGTGYSVQLLAGSLYKHTNKIYLHERVFPTSMEFSWQKQTQGNQLWQQRFGYPETALNILTTYNGHRALGFTLGIYPSIQFKIRNQFFFKMGGGMGVVTKYWQRNPASDTLNNIIGGALNNVTMFQFGYQRNLSGNWILRLGAHFHHASNASARQPNFGINTYGVFAGIKYQVAGTPQNSTSIAQPANKLNQQLIGLKWGYSLAEDKTPDGPMYPAYSMALLLQHTFRNKIRGSLGWDATYYSRLYSLYKSEHKFDGREKAKAWRNSIVLGGEFLFGKIGMPLQLGVYLDRPIAGPWVYQKLGLNYYIVQKKRFQLFGFTQLKTHFAQAELAEFGLGICF